VPFALVFCLSEPCP